MPDPSTVPVVPPSPGPVEPALDLSLARGPTRAVALVLPGGSGAETGPGDRYRPTVLRMLPFGWDLHRAGRRRGLTVALLRYRVAGWKHGADSAEEDVRWALDRLRARFGPVPVVLVGHSMGGRAALATADEPSVVGVVALAPWVGDGVRVADLSGRTVVLAHGDRDETTSPAATRALAERARRAGVRVEFVSVPGDGHAMLRHAGTWQRIVRGGVLGVLGDALLPSR